MNGVEKIIEEATASIGNQGDQGNLIPEKPEAGDVQTQEPESDSDDGGKDPVEGVIKDLGETYNEDDGEGPEDDDGDEYKPEGDKSDDGKPKSNKGRKPKVSVQISKLRMEKREAELRAAKAEGEVEALRKMKEQQLKDSHEGKEAVLTEPEPDLDPESFENETEYMNAKIAYEVKKAEQKILDSINQGKAKETQAQAAAKENAERNAVIQAKGDEFEKTHPDFWETVKDVGDDFYSVVAINYIAQSEKGAELAYVLAKAPSFNRKVLGMSPIMQIRELSRLEDKLSGGSKGLKVPKTTPITPIKGGRRSVKTGLPNNPTDAEAEAFVRNL
jgi:hypothetical protein